MCRDQFPRLFELRDLLPESLPTGLAIPALDNTLMTRGKRERFKIIEADLQSLDTAAWEAIKTKLEHWPKAHKARAFEPLYDILNEVKGCRYLCEIGCVGVKFLSESRRKNEKTPDLRLVAVSSG